MPNRLLMALKASSSGAASATPALWTGSLSIPTNKVSARLYSTITSELRMVGTDKVITALGTGRSSNRARRDCSIFPTPSIHSAVLRSAKTGGRRLFPPAKDRSGAYCY